LFTKETFGDIQYTTFYETDDLPSHPTLCQAMKGLEQLAVTMEYHPLISSTLDPPTDFVKKVRLPLLPAHQCQYADGYNMQ